MPEDYAMSGIPERAGGRPLPGMAGPIRSTYTPRTALDTKMPQPRPPLRTAEQMRIEHEGKGS